MKIKICGVRDEASARACAEAGVDLAGFNFVPGRRRAITPETAAALGRILSTSDRPPEPCGVFMDSTLDEIDEVTRRVPLEWIQLHGSEPPELCARLSERFRVIKAFAASPGFDPSACASYVDSVSAFLIDGPAPGSGRSFDWAAMRDVSRERPIFLAGGLDPDNVARAIAATRPDGVDTASGVETGGAPDPAKIRAFCAAARSAR